MTLLRTIRGFLLFCWLCRKGLYHGLTAFYRRAQEGDAVARELLTGPIGRLVQDWTFSQANRERPRLSDRAIARYSDDSLAGYGDEDFDKGGDTIEQQQRGLILPLLADLSGTVVEI